MDSAPQQSFGKYRILERISSGSMSEIFKARLDGIGGFHRLFAIKRIRPELSQDQEYVDLLVEEAKVAGLLSHANIVQILDLGKIDDLYYVAMEYVDGRDLGSVLLRCAGKGITLPVPHAVFSAIEMLKGLDYAHKRQILRGGRPVPLHITHRDIRPANILVSFQGEVKLTDFGLGRARRRLRETSAGLQAGRFDYLSPEQAAGEEASNSSDLFSAGVLLYEMLCGVHPFRRQGDIQTLEAIKKAAYSPPSHVNPDVPYVLEKVLDRALALEPASRFESAAALKAELDNFFHESGFIFSHSTLAAFLKGLFPEATAKRKSTKSRPPEQPTVPYDSKQVAALIEETEAGDKALLASEDMRTAGDVSELGDGNIPTSGEGNIPTSLGDLETIMRQAPDTASTGSFGPTPSPTDDATLIRRRPPTEEDDEGSGEWSKEGNTQLLDGILVEDESYRTAPPVNEPSYSLDSSASTDNLLASERLESAEKFNLPPPSPGAAATARIETGAHKEEAQEPRLPRRTQSGGGPSVRTKILVVLMTIGGLLMGLSLGFFLGAGQNPPPPIEEAPDPAPRYPPTLLVNGPAGARLQVGDRAYTLEEGEETRITLDAGEPTTIRVELEGYTPIEHSYTLQENEERTWSIVWDQLRERR